MKALRIIGYIFSGIQLVLSGLVLYLALSTNFIPMGYGIAAGVVMLLLVGLNIFLATKKSKATRITAIIIAVIISAVMAFAIYYLKVTIETMSEVTGITTEIDEINVYVSKDDAVSSINEAIENNYIFGRTLTDDQAHINETIGKIEMDFGQTIETKEYESISELIEGFEAGEIQSFVTNAGTIAMYESASEENLDYSSKLKTIMENTIVEEIEEEPEAEVADQDHFCVYFSGIDTFGTVSAKSRSDVNIIAAVNNETKQILLVSTPRDYYIPLSVSKGKKDKLTHAGLYGVDCSEKSLEELYDIDINYYVKLNFSGFQSIIDEIGGVDVDSEFAFVSETEEGTYSFSKGINHLNGEEALGFARSRNFKEGDRQRGRNQMQVIKATISKLESPNTLKNYSGIMEKMNGFFQTDMTTEDVGYLVQSTLQDGNWEVLTYSVGGNDATETCYSTGSQPLYVMLPNDDDVEYGNSIIKRLLSGEKLTQDEINVYLDTKDAQDVIDEDAVNSETTEE